MPLQYVMVRLTKDAYTSLAVIRDILAESDANRKGAAVRRDHLDRVSLSEAVRILCDGYWKHRQRARQSKLRKAKEKLDQLDQDKPGPDQVEG